MENLDLIDWPAVGFACLWIAGLALILSAVGFADYHAARAGRKFRQEIVCPNYAAAINVGLVLFCLGMIGSARAGWEAALWVGLAVAFAVYTFRSLRQMRRDKAD